MKKGVLVSSGVKYYVIAAKDYEALLSKHKKETVCPRCKKPWIIHDCVTGEGGIDLKEEEHKKEMRQVGKKKCPKCLEVKSVNEFYVIKSRKDGYSRVCKLCECKYQAASYYKNWEKQKDRRREYHRLHRAEDSEKDKSRWGNEKHKGGARNKLRNAVYAGKIKRPSNCEMCGEKLPVQGHHSDYNEPFRVLWLCKDCHARLDRKYEPTELMEYGLFKKYHGELISDEKK